MISSDVGFYLLLHYEKCRKKLGEIHPYTKAVKLSIEIMESKLK